MGAQGVRFSMIVMTGYHNYQKNNTHTELEVKAPTFWVNGLKIKVNCKKFTFFFVYTLHSHFFSLSLIYN